LAVNLHSLRLLDWHTAIVSAKLVMKLNYCAYL